MWQLTFDAKWIIMFVENITKLKIWTIMCITNGFQWMVLIMHNGFQWMVLIMDYSGWC